MMSWFAGARFSWIAWRARWSSRARLSWWSRFPLEVHWQQWRHICEERKDNHSGRAEHLGRSQPLACRERRSSTLFLTQEGPLLQVLRKLADKAKLSGARRFFKKFFWVVENIWNHFELKTAASSGHRDLFFSPITFY